MAGAGYKLFSTGDVLTATDVNTYLMQQTVMVFNDATARTTALSGVVAEGMLSYLKDTNVVEVYNGSSWVSSDDPNAIQNTIVAAKGDIIGASANDVPAVTSVGADGTTLVADSSTATGLAYIPTFFAGKNKIINGDFRINQRGFTSTTTSGTYTFDRFFTTATDGTSTYSAQTFTPGAAPVSGYEAINFVRLESTGQTATSAQTRLRNPIEDVRTFAGETVTVSFWAKASTGTPNVAVNLNQIFGSGGSSTVLGTGQKFAITTSWVRYSKTFTVASISGKTIGTGSYLNLNLWTSAGSDVNTQTDSLGIQSVTIDFWGVQLEAGSTATAFQTATGTIQGELAACQRYYYRTGAGDIYSGYGNGVGKSTTTAYILVNFPETMRTIPSSTIDGTGTVSNYALYDGTNVVAATAITADRPQVNNYSITVTVASGLTQYRPYVLINNNTSAAFLGFSAEL